jgi:beta-phosphoglucomutase-like phosphatase (HAD superfamily)
MLDSVLFEFDGVLADTADAREDALRSTLHVDGVDLSDDEYRSACAGLSFEEAARNALALRAAPGDASAIALVALRADRTYQAYLGKGLRLAEGAREVIERFLPVTRLGIVTRSSRREVGFVLALARLEHAFTCIIAAEDAYPGKPSPAPYRAAMERLARQRPPLAHARVVAFENALAGIRAARGARIECVAVGDLPVHVAIEADALLPGIAGLTPDQLLTLLRRSSEPIV